MTTAPQRKASGQDGTARASAGANVAGAETFPDAGGASSEAVKVAQRRALIELLSTPGVLELDEPEVMAGAWR